MAGINERLGGKERAIESRTRMSGKDAEPVPEPLAEATKAFAAGAIDQDAQQLPGMRTQGGQP